MKVAQVLLAAALATGLPSAAVQAQPYPSKPVKVVVPLTPGSPVDVVARLVGQHMAAALGQPMIVENRPGAGATLRAKSRATPAAGGETVLHTPANHPSAPPSYQTPTY